MRQSVGEPYCELAGHQKKVQLIEWHPVAANVILSAGVDNVILIWNVLMSEVMFHVEVPEQVINIWFCAAFVKTNCSSSSKKLNGCTVYYH